MTEHIQMNLFDEEILHPNCTVQELRNTETGEVSFGWWENESPPKGVVKTNYDRLRAKSVEEMAEFLTLIMMGEERSVPFIYSTVDKWLDWLKEEVAE